MGLLFSALIARVMALAPYLGIGLLVESLASNRRVPAHSARLNVGVMLLHWVGYIFTTSIVTVAVFRFIVSLPRPEWLPQPHPQTWPAVLAWALALAVIHDFFYYWMHRAQHMIPVLWAQHAVHHSDEDFNVTTAWRTHWTEPLLETIFMVAPTAYLFSTDVRVVLALGIISDSINAFAHLNVPATWTRLHWVINNPQLHRTHHSILPEHVDRNFAGKWPVWDRLFGTYADPGDQPPTGLRSGERIGSLFVAAVYPIRRWTVMVMAAFSSESSR